MKGILLSIAVAFFACVAQAEGTDTHGGDGVIIGETVYLLDLVEQGVEENPYFNPEVQTDEAVRQRVERALTGIQDAPIDLVAKKMTELMIINPAFAITLLKAVEMHIWRLVRFDLVDVPDEDSVLVFKDHKLIQLAIRRMQGISIAREHWLRMSMEQRAALIFHEAVYAVISPHKEWVTLPDKTRVEKLVQNPIKVREITGYLFSPVLPVRGAVGLESLTNHGGRIFLPVVMTPIKEQQNGFEVPSNKIGLQAWILKDGTQRSVGRYIEFRGSQSLEVIELFCRDDIGDASIQKAGIELRFPFYSFGFALLQDAVLGDRVYLAWYKDVPTQSHNIAVDSKTCAKDFYREIEKRM